MVLQRLRSDLLGWVVVLMLVGLAGLFAAMNVDQQRDNKFSGELLRQHLHRRGRVPRRMESFKSPSFISTTTSSKISSSSSSPNSHVFYVTDYGADPTGTKDSTAAILQAIADAFNSSSNFGRVLMPAIPNLGGVEIHLSGGEYLIKAPIQLPSSCAGNLKIHGGSLRASDDFPTDRYLIEMWANSKQGSSSDSNSTENISTRKNYDFEYITLKDLMLDSNFRGGGIAVVNALRTTIDNIYAVHFASDGVWVKDGHETYIHNCFIGQHITAGNDPHEKNFTGTGISLMGNDNAVTDVVIFSASTGILILGQANSISGAHCYNKASGFRGTGIYIKSPGLSQTRIINCYLDFTGIVAEDPVQLLVTSSFFLGNANVVFKSVKGTIKGVNVVDNLFSGKGGTVDIVELDESGGGFTSVEQVVVDRNAVEGMSMKTTVARTSMQGTSSTWTVDFLPVLLFPDRIEHVQYSLRAAKAFPKHAIRNVTGNKVVIESDIAVPASIDVSVHQFQ